MQQNYPDLAIDGEMQVNFAMDRKMRDAKYPFTRLKGKDVNTLYSRTSALPTLHTNCCKL